MNQRERMLAIVVGFLVVGAGLFYGTKSITKIFTSRSETIAKLQDDIDGKEVLRHRGSIARRVLDEYAKRSLPGNQELANSRYRAWLHQWCKQAKIERANVNYISKQQVLLDKEPIFDQHTFSVSCQATLPQLVALLYEFYSEDYLHRIKTMTAVPLGKDKQLLVNIWVEALAFPGVADHELVAMPSQRLAFDSLDKYYDVIVERNPYSPANEPPKFAGDQTERGIVNRRMSFKPSVDDPEKGQLTFRVDHDGLEGLTIDPQTGKIEWTPDKVGEFEVLVYATDDGLPAKESSQKIRLAVAEPPPPREDPPPRRTFDEAKYTFVTGIVEVNGRRQVWLTLRTEGKRLRLFEGDSFQVGSLEGKILRIHEREVEIKTPNQVLSVRFGQNLSEGHVLSTNDEEVATAERS